MIFYVVLSYYFHPATAGSVFADDYLLVDSLLKLVDVGDYSDKAVTLGKTFERIHSLIKRFIIERAKALVNKHCIKSDASCRCLNFVGKPQSKRQRRFK